MHRITVESTCEGYRVSRPGWPPEFVDDARLAERWAESLAHEYHQLHGRPACALRDGQAIARFG